MLVNDDFQILFGLLEYEEVTGRGAATISSELREKVTRFAAGICTEDERNQMKKLLIEKPELIPVLANEARALRKSDQ